MLKNSKNVYFDNKTNAVIHIIRQNQGALNKDSEYVLGFHVLQ